MLEALLIIFLDVFLDKFSLVSFAVVVLCSNAG